MATNSATGGTPHISGAPRAAGTRYVLIDAMRGIACLAVVLFHAMEGGHLGALVAAMPAWFGHVLERGNAGVDVFFVISGFVIANSMMRDEVTGGYVGRFLLRRSLRLDPPYWASMVLVVAAGYVAAHAVPGRGFALPTPGNVLLHMTYLVDITRQPLINPVYWTLCFEIQFYLSFALLMWLATALGRRIGRARAIDLMLVACAAVSALWVTPWAPFRVPGLFLELWYLFIIGVLARRAIDARPLGLASVGAAAYVVLLAVLLALPDGRLHNPIGLATGLFVLIAGHSGVLARVGGGALLQWLGLISYSLYLTHNTVTGAAFRLIYRFTGRSPASEALGLLMVIVLCCLFAWAFFLVFERVGLYWSKKVPLHKPARAPALPPRHATAPID
jgi:peptidoglycan/LPS O-acetylase OafA/YrhL